MGVEGPDDLDADPPMISAEEIEVGWLPGCPATQYCGDVDSPALELQDEMARRANTGTS
jgi:hypothetical protein